MKNTDQAAVSKPVHIEDNEALVAKLRAGRAKAAADLASQARKQAAQHQRLNRAADLGNRR
jgi:hypothetical protein